MDSLGAVNKYFEMEETPSIFRCKAAGRSRQSGDHIRARRSALGRPRKPDQYSASARPWVAVSAIRSASCPTRRSLAPGTSRFCAATRSTAREGAKVHARRFRRRSARCVRTIDARASAERTLHLGSLQTTARIDEPVHGRSPPAWAYITRIAGTACDDNEHSKRGEANYPGSTASA